MLENPVVWALIGTGFTFLMTTVGSASVFFLKGEVKPIFNQVFLGFAAGVMIAASSFSLLVPAIEQAGAQGDIPWIPTVGGFILGGVFLFVLDKAIPHLHPGSTDPEGPHSPLRRTSLLMTAVTLHNIPEGMAVGLSFALMATGDGMAALPAAIALALGIGAQNLPEGAAIALPLRQEGLSRWKAFLYGSLSGIVEPIFGVLIVIIVGTSFAAMPWLLSFAAGAMIYVVVEELIPSAHLGEHTNAGTVGVMVGFALMMLLDVGLG